MIMLRSFWSSLLIALMDALRTEEFICDPMPLSSPLLSETASMLDWLIMILEVALLATYTSLVCATYLSLIFLSTS